MSPGWIATSNTRLKRKHHSQHPAGRVGRPADVAETVAFLLDGELVELQSAGGIPVASVDARNGGVGAGGVPRRGGVEARHDFEQQLLQYYQAAMNYNSQCYGLRLEFRESKLGALLVNDREIRFSLSLKNVGTFLDLNSRSSTIQP